MRLPEARSTAHLYEIHVYGRPRTVRRVGRRWIPLYTFDSELRCKAVFKMLITMEDAELSKNDSFFDKWVVEDLRIVHPDPKADYNYQRSAIRRAARKGRDIRPLRRVEQPRQRTILGPSGVVLRMPRATVVGSHRRPGNRMQLRSATHVGRRAP